jgi:hypothetical protein
MNPPTHVQLAHEAESGSAEYRPVGHCVQEVAPASL